MGKLFYQLYQPCGLFNQITSLELAVGLAERYNKTLVIHNINNPPNSDYGGARVPIYSANYQFSNRGDVLEKGIFPSLPDLVDWKNKDSSILIEDTIDFFPEQNRVISNLMEYYSSEDIIDDSLRDEFSEGRKNLVILKNESIHVKNTLGYYSRFFYDRSPDLDKAIASVRFKPEYYQLAKKIADSIGSFNGIHFRLADHKGFFDPDSSILDFGVNKLDGNLPIVLCTDEPDSPIIKGSDFEYIFLDRYIIDNFYKDFMEFEFREEVSFGILNNLVMHYSQDFVGSPGSTYTGYIHRALNQNKDIEWKLFGEFGHYQSGKYSWNGYNDRDTFTKQWWREWKESRLSL